MEGWRNVADEQQMPTIDQWLTALSPRGEKALVNNVGLWHGQKRTT